MSKRLYTPAEVQAAFVAWATLSRELFPTEDRWIYARRELWNVYCDARDNKPRGTSFEKEAAIPVGPKLSIVH